MQASFRKLTPQEMAYNAGKRQALSKLGEYDCGQYMARLSKTAFIQGAEQALEDLGLPGLDLDGLIQAAKESLVEAGGAVSDAGSVAINAVGGGAQDAYGALRSLLGQGQAQ